ncbi:DUF5668 domain-containing protein [Parabacteroides sp. PF5-6]|uniref:LiaF transmembrane domain-containing protein n=1 Tax=Parabacteroides sp. PF5-6 TaxID=1742403 RepID=UPI002405323B|nr:DUF5668 domain-containing protein [Parabacteroides sp. PF5-6]MDF9831129.1 putative membrane protein [Parabacteroides sp. PF5-6]
MNAFHEHHHRYRKLNTIAVSFAFIFVGVMFLARNFGWVDHSVFSFVISWQMLLVYIGLFQLIKRNIMGGLIMITFGSYFLLPSDYGLGTYWPVLLILIGIGILFKRQMNHTWGHKNLAHGATESSSVVDGFVHVDISFGGTKHIVLDPVFQGAQIDVSFGSMVLDLRRTALEKPVTAIDLDCSFGSIELYIPGHWNVILRTDNSFGGIQDKRMVAHQIDYEHELLIRGDVSFGGVEIKS